VLNNLSIEWWRTCSEPDSSGESEAVLEQHKEMLFRVALGEIQEQMAHGADKGNFEAIRLRVDHDDSEFVTYRGYWKVTFSAIAE
jgi:hypothetical protein